MSTPPVEPKKSAAKISTISSAVLWIAAFALPFVTPPKWQFYWISDSLLLIGFWPLMYTHPASWTWLVFGVCNFAIGAVLEVANVLPAEVYPHDLLSVRQHMHDFHEPLVWMITGVISTIYGIGRLVKGLAVKRLSKNK